VDVGARLEIYEQLRGLAAAGAGLIVVTTEIEEALTLCDRVIVIYDGAVIASMECSETSEQEVFVAMQGVAPDGGTVVA
jgi:ribose transport system ATP-binding protein